jgi:hypothetical protein
LLLLELVMGDIIASLLLDLVASELVLHKGEVVRMRKRLFAGAVRVETIVYRWGRDLRVEWTLANTRAVGCAPSVVELKGLQLSARVSHVAVRIAVWRV